MHEENTRTSIILTGMATAGVGGALGREIGGGLFGAAAGSMLASGIAAKAAGGKFIDGMKSGAKGFAVGMAATYVGNKLAAKLARVGESTATNGAQKGGFFSGVRTWLANTLWPSHYARMEINALNVDAIGLGTTGLTDEVLREAGMERSGYEWKMFHDKGSGGQGQQRWTMTSGEYAGTEMVVGTNENLILNQPINSASYNYGKTGFGHTVKDVLPYIMFGNSPNDPSNIFQRIGRFGKIPRRKLFESPSAYGQ